jgi:CheY-like chemotaxis protein
MGGTIELDSTIDVGSIFTLTLKLPIVERTLGIGVPILAGRTVLIVDPSQASRRTMVELLSGWGANSIVANEEEEAMILLERYKDQSIEAAIINQGPAAAASTARRLRSQPEFESLPLLCLSSRTSQAPQQTLFTRLIAKPIKRVEFREAMMGILLPEAAPAKPKSIQLFEALNWSSTPLVLLTEDNPTNQKVGKFTLERLGCSVVIAVDGLDAVDKAEHGSYDLIFMDIQMPRLDGYGATAAIRSLGDQEKRSVPIVAMTANAMSGDREKCLEAGMDDYIAKPVTPAALIPVLKRWIRDSELPRAA